MDIGPRVGDNRIMHYSFALMLLLGVACGPGGTNTAGSATDPTDATSGEPGTTGAPTTDTPTGASSGEPPATTGEPGTSVTASSGEVTSAADSSSGDILVTSGGETTTGAPDTGDTTGAGDEVMYAAAFFAGGLDHLLIFKANITQDRCTSLHLAWPGGRGDPNFQIATPGEWKAQNGGITDTVTGCLEGMLMGAGVGAIGGVGEVPFEQGPQEYCPTELDIDVTLMFPPDMPGVPAEDHLQATAVPVQNCP